MSWADKEVNVVELGGEGSRNVVTLYHLTQESRGMYYDQANDSLYFTDEDKISPHGQARALYRLDLRKNFFDQLMRRLKKEFDARYEKRPSL